jgi:bifunctional non-homologous end joining protein LigD
MKAVAGILPTTSEGWYFELNWDGMRVIAEIADGELTVYSAKGADYTDRFPELLPLAQATFGLDVVLDAEVVAFDEDSKPTFAAVQQRIHLTDPEQIRAMTALRPVHLALFDILALGGTDSSSLPFEQRRQLLERAVEAGSNWHVTTIERDGEALLAAAAEAGLEGIMAKRASSTYRRGERSDAWRKIKLTHQDEFLVCGWTDGTGARASTFGSLVLGMHDRVGRLQWAGNLGSGFRSDDLETLSRRLRGSRPTVAPFNDPAIEQAHFVEPEIVVQVRYAEWSPLGRLRHPVYLGERPDVDPTAVNDPRDALAARN